MIVKLPPIEVDPDIGEITKYAILQFAAAFAIPAKQLTASQQKLIEQLSQLSEIEFKKMYEGSFENLDE